MASALEIKPQQTFLHGLRNAHMVAGDGFGPFAERVAFDPFLGGASY